MSDSITRTGCSSCCPPEKSPAPRPSPPPACFWTSCATEGLGIPCLQTAHPAPLTALAAQCSCSHSPCQPHWLPPCTCCHWVWHALPLTSPWLPLSLPSGHCPNTIPPVGQKWPLHCLPRYHSPAVPVYCIHLISPLQPWYAKHHFTCILRSMLAAAPIHSIVLRLTCRKATSGPTPPQEECHS